MSNLMEVSMELGMIVFVAVFALWHYWLNASMVRARDKFREALSSIDVQLKKRSNLIPNVLTITKRFMEHEAELLTGMTELRTRADAGYDAANPDAVDDHLQAASDGTYSFKLLAAWLIEKHPFDRPLYEHIRDHNTVECRMVRDVRIV